MPSANDVYITPADRKIEFYKSSAVKSLLYDNGGDLYVSGAADLHLDAAGNNIMFDSNGTKWGEFGNNNTYWDINGNAGSSYLRFIPWNGGAGTTAYTYWGDGTHNQTIYIRGTDSINTNSTTLANNYLYQYDGAGNLDTLIQAGGSSYFVNSLGIGLSTTPGETLHVAGTARITGKTAIGSTTAPSLDGLSVSNTIQIAEKSSISSPAGAGWGTFWVSGSAPNVPMFTDDAGTTIQLKAGIGGTVSDNYIPLATADDTLGNFVPAYVEAQNIFIGKSQRNTTADADDNTTLGYNAGYELTTGDRNVLIGRNAGDSITTATSNVAIGRYAMSDASTDGYMVAIGTSAGSAATDGSVSVGHTAGAAAGAKKVAIGYQALLYPSGSNNTAIGYKALIGASSGVVTAYNNTSVGYEAGMSITTGYQNVFMGAQAGDSITTATRNVIIGAQSVESSNTSESVIIGAYAAFATSTAINSSVIIGTYAAQSASPSKAVILGRQSGYYATGEGNTYMGYQSGYGDATTNNATYNTAVGYEAMEKIQSGNENVAIGSQALWTNTAGSQNVALGANALYVSTTAHNNVAVGHRSMFSSTTATENVAVGKSALADLTEGDDNVALGYLAGSGITTGQDNAIVGSQAGSQMSAGDSNNAFFGERAGYNNAGGNYNTFIGRRAGYNVTTGDDNVFIGNGAGPSSTSTASDKLYIHNEEGTPLIGGDFSAGEVTINGASSKTITLDPYWVVSGDNQYSRIHANTGLALATDDANIDLWASNNRKIRVRQRGSGDAYDGTANTILEIYKTGSTSTGGPWGSIIRAPSGSLYMATVGSYNMTFDCANTMTTHFDTEYNIYSAADGNSRFTIREASKAAIEFEGDGDIQFKDGTTKLMILTSGGNLGIGTDGPSTKLDVQGSILVDPSTGSDTAGTSAGIKFNAQDDAGVGWNLRLGDTSDDGDFNIDRLYSSTWYKSASIDRSTGDFIWYDDDGSTEKMRWDASTNRLGIGIAAPAYTLDVSSGYTNSARLYLNDANNYIMGESDNMYLRAHNDMYFNIDTPGDSILRHFIFRTNTSTEIMRLGEDKIAEFKGNVGIGTGAPPNALSVWKAINNDFVAELKNTHATAGQSWGLQVCAGTNASDAALAVENEAENASLLYVRGDGNVGIGTTAPLKKLDVRGDNSTWALAALSGSSEYGTGLQLYNSHTTVQDWAIIGGGASKNYTFRIYDQTDAKYRLAIDRDGKVGIGGTNAEIVAPDTALHLRSSTANEPVLLIQNTTADANSGELQFYKSTTDEAVNDYAGKLSFYFDNDAAQKTLGAKIYSTAQSVTDGAEGGYLYFSTMKAGTEVVTMTMKSGNVGFGPNTPSYHYMFSKHASADTNILIQGNDADWLWQNKNSDGSLLWKQNTDGVSAMTLTSGGNLGIGTTSPAQKLHVAGSVEIEGHMNFDLISDGTAGTMTTASYVWNLAAMASPEGSTSQSQTITLPASPTAGDAYVIIGTAVGENQIPPLGGSAITMTATLTSNSSKTINGQSGPLTIATATGQGSSSYFRLECIYEGNEWNISKATML